MRRLLEQLGPENETPEGTRLQLKIEPWPGGRWYRDLGDGNGHFWGVVQAIKRPTLLEFSGPLFMSYPAVSNVQYRLSEKDGGTLITFHHLGFGLITDEHRSGVQQGWHHMNEKGAATGGEQTPTVKQEDGNVSSMCGERSSNGGWRGIEGWNHRAGAESISPRKKQSRKT